MGKLKNCFVDQGAEFYRNVEVDGDVVARIRALTPIDRDHLRSYIKVNNAGFIDVTGSKEQEMQIAKCVIACGGKINNMSYKRGEEGWEFDRECNVENMNMLDFKYFIAIKEAIDKMEEDWIANKEGYLKNLNTPSD